MATTPSDVLIETAPNGRAQPPTLAASLRSDAPTSPPAALDVPRPDLAERPAFGGSALNSAEADVPADGRNPGCEACGSGEIAPAGALSLPQRPVRASILRRAIAQFDELLSRQNQVREFTTDSSCMIRYAPIASPTLVSLSDGARIAPGELVLDLHLWNPHVPRVPSGGPNLAWARRTRAQFHHSLEALARAVAERPDLKNARACRARMNCVGQGHTGESLSHLIERFGFEDVDEGFASMQHVIHDALENILISALVWTHNPEALRRDKLIRKRRPVWISRDRLLQRYGGRSR